MGQVRDKASGILNKISSEAHEMAARPPVEGEMTKRIEQQTAKIPSIGFLGLAVGSMVASAALAFVAQRKELANFVGLWAPSLLLIGIYNKLVKLEGSDFRSHPQHAQQGGQGVSSEGYAGQSYGAQTYGSQGVSGQDVTGQGYSGV
jgi:hypothetical protein